MFERKINRSGEVYSDNFASNFNYARARIQMAIHLDSLTLEDWTEDHPWTKLELERFGYLFATQETPPNAFPFILSDKMERLRQRREIYLSKGDMDAIVAPGLYWRTHPRGRRFRDKEERRAGGKSFYV